MPVARGYAREAVNHLSDQTLTKRWSPYSPADDKGLVVQERSSMFGGHAVFNSVFGHPRLFRSGRPERRAHRPKRDNAIIRDIRAIRGLLLRTASIHKREDAR